MARPPSALDNLASARRIKRRRLLLYGAVAVVLLMGAASLLVIVNSLPRRLPNGEREIPNPIQMVKDWLFPPRLLRLEDAEGKQLVIVVDPSDSMAVVNGLEPE